MKTLYTASNGLMVLFVSLITFAGCDNTKEYGKAVDPDSIYFDYRITGEEGNDKLTVLLLFRDGDEEGDAISVSN